MTFVEKLKYAEILKKYCKGSDLIRSFWDLSAIVDSKEAGKDIDTLCIGFNHKGDPLFMAINTEFFYGLNDDVSRAFVLAHEMLHVFLKHGQRFKDPMKKHPVLVNFATDVAINHMLCNFFDFDRNSLDPFLRDEGCWIDTTFRDFGTIPPPNKSADFYLKLIMDKMSEIMDKFKGELKDMTSGGSSSGGSDSGIDLGGTLIGEVMGELEEQIIQEESENFAKGIEGYEEKCEEIKKSGDPSGVDESNEDSISKATRAGRESATITNTIITVNSRRNSAWSKFARGLATSVEKGSAAGLSAHSVRWDFSRTSRRNHTLAVGGAFVPARRTKKIVLPDKKLDIAIYLDFSCSCASYSEKLLEALASIDRGKFILRPYLFSTEVGGEVKRNKKGSFVLSEKISGGTCFQIINDHYRRYNDDADAVWVLTDGYGNNITGQFNPDKWTWFLVGHSNRYNTTIPQDNTVELLPTNS